MGCNSSSTLKSQWPIHHTPLHTKKGREVPRRSTSFSSLEGRALQRNHRCISCVYSGRVTVSNCMPFFWSEGKNDIPVMNSNCSRARSPFCQGSNGRTRRTKGPKKKVAFESLNFHGTNELLNGCMQPTLSSRTRTIEHPWLLLAVYLSLSHTHTLSLISLSFSHSLSRRTLAHTSIDPPDLANCPWIAAC